MTEMASVYNKPDPRWIGDRELTDQEDDALFSMTGGCAPHGLAYCTTPGCERGKPSGVFISCPEEYRMLDPSNKSSNK